MQAEGIVATAKHFTGHGDTEMDYTMLPLCCRIHSKSTMELAPFRQQLQQVGRYDGTYHLFTTR
jgi:beta-glucosidase-like glycosyl hydrolase